MKTIKHYQSFELPKTQQEMFDWLLRYESTDERVIDVWKLAEVLLYLSNNPSQEPPKEKECAKCGEERRNHTSNWHTFVPNVEIKGDSILVRNTEKMIVLGVDGDRIFLATYYDDYEYRTAVIYSKEELEQYGWKLAN